MPSTTNFNWTTPADTDLVKDGALAIRTLGNGIDTSFLDLKGGATGDSLVKASATDLDYNWTRLADQVLANPVINGGMDCWQRGTSFTANNAYTADRWYMSNVSGTGRTASRQTTSDTTNLPNIQYAIRLQRDSGNTVTTDNSISQSLESTNSLPFAGKTVTLSFYARRGANFSASGNNLTAQLRTGTGTDQNTAAGFTGSSNIISQSATLTTTWQRFAYSATVGTTATQLGVIFIFAGTGTAGANDWFEVTGVQLDVGTFTAANAPTFRRAGGTIQGELAVCQRYYWRATNTGTNDAMAPTGTATSTTSVTIQGFHPVVMRGAPSSVDYSNVRLYDGVNVFTPSSITQSFPNATTYQIAVAVASGLTQYRPYYLIANTGTSYAGMNAEL